MWSSVQSEEVNQLHVGLSRLKNRRQEKKIWQHPFCRQVYVSLGPLSLILSAGMGLGTATVMIPQLRKDNSTTGIRLEPEMETWLYSVHGFAAIPTSLMVPYLGKLKGYKVAFFLTCCPIVVAFLIQYFATSGKELLAAALLQGLTMGGNVSLGVIILSELADPKYRGFFLILKGASFFWGIWIANAIGTYSSWRNISITGVWASLFAFLTSLAWPESPYWLASKGLIEDCKKSFRWLRGQEQDAENELSILISTTLEVQKDTREPKGVLQFSKTTITSRQFYMPMFLNLVLFFLYQACGKYVCQTYVIVIINDIAKSESLAYTGMLILDGVTVFGMYLGSYVGMKVKRRLLLISTSFSTVFFLYALSLYLCLVDYKFISPSNAIPLSFLILYSFSVCWGPMNLCTTIYAEITPLRYKPFITGVTVSFMFLFHAGFLKLAPLIFKAVGVNKSFSVYATMTLLALLIICKYMPETSNKTLEEIEAYFVNSKYSTRSNDNEGEKMLGCTEQKRIPLEA